MKFIKRVCIVGAGSIGSLYAGHLASVAEVTILTRREEHAARLNREGLRVSGKSQRHANVYASTNPDELGAVDLVIVATKTIHVEQSVSRLRGYFPNALIMLAQNGLGCEELVARYGDWPILSAVTFMAGSRYSDVHVEYELDTATWIGPWCNSNASYEDAIQVTALLESSGLKAEAFEDILPAQWSKLIFNSAVNSIAAVTGLPFCQHYAEREKLSDLGHLVYDTIEEGKRVAEACGVSLLEDPWQMVLKAAGLYHTERGKGRVPSMLADVRARQQTEVEAITGAVVRQAEKALVPVPVHASLYRLIVAIQSTW